MLLLNDKTIETCWILVSLLEHKDNHGIGILSWRGQSQSWEILSHWIVNQLIAITTININNFLFSVDSGRSWPLSGGGAWSRWAGPGAGADTGPLTPPGAAAGARRSSGGSSTGAHSAGTRGYPRYILLYCHYWLQTGQLGLFAREACFVIDVLVDSNVTRVFYISEAAMFGCAKTAASSTLCPAMTGSAPSATKTSKWSVPSDRLSDAISHHILTIGDMRANLPRLEIWEQWFMSGATPRWVRRWGISRCVSCYQVWASHCHLVVCYKYQHKDKCVFENISLEIHVWGYEVWGFA